MKDSEEVPALIIAIVFLVVLVIVMAIIMNKVTTENCIKSPDPGNINYVFANISDCNRLPRNIAETMSTNNVECYVTLNETFNPGNFKDFRTIIQVGQSNTNLMMMLVK
jgi:hypothetical protein